VKGYPEAFALAVVMGLMLAEARLSRQNEQRLRARGAVAPPGDSYRAMSVIYPGAFLVMGAEGFWRLSRTAVSGIDPLAPSWFAAGVLLMLASKALKYWAIAHLGDRWTFKVLVLRGAAPVRTGPYRYVDHPNYIAVFGELAAMALMMTAWITGPLMVLLFGLALRVRLPVEVRSLRNGGQEW
jgi:methyltransferase